MNVILFQPRFEALILAGTKTQTIRPPRCDGRLRARLGETVSLRAWTGLPYRSKQREFARAEVVKLVFPVVVRCSRVLVRGVEQEPESFARADGFGCFYEMAHWFNEAHGLPFTGELIGWQMKPCNS